MDPPVVPRARLDGWQCIDETTERAFTAGFVSVDASTVRYERDATEPRVRSASRVACGSARRPRRTRPSPRSSSAERARGSATASQSATSRTSNTAATERSRSTIRRRRARRSRRSAASQASAPGTDVYRSRRYSRSGRPASIYSAGARTPSTRRRTRPERARATRVENCWGSFAGWSHPTTAAKRSYKRLRPANTEPRPRPSRSATPRRDTRSRRSIRRTSGAEVRRRTARQTPRTGRHRSRWPPARSA